MRLEMNSQTSFLAAHMLRKGPLARGSAVVLSSLALSFVGCADAESERSTSGDDLGVDIDALGAAVASCSTAGSSGFNTSTKALALSISGVPTVVISAVSGVIKVNGWSCVDPSGVALTTTTVKKISVTGTAAAEKVILDLLPGSFGSNIFSSTGGVTVDLAGGTDSFMVRGTNSADKITVGHSGSDEYVELSGDTKADVKLVGVESATFSTLGGADTITGAGGAISATHLTAGVSTLTAATIPLTVFGGDGNDTIQGGTGNDTLNGGNGDDTFKTAATADGDDVMNGDAGTDTADYSTRAADLTIDVGPSDGSADGDDGDSAAGEADDVTYTVENVNGGSGNDTITGSDVTNTINGNAGDDVLNGGPANSDCTLDADVINGGADDDTLDATDTADCGDSFSGGTGTDIADYQFRTGNLTITVDTSANDGEAGEGDKIQTDVEIVLGGDGDDSITGGSGADELHGRPGDDTLNGGSGNDTLIGNDGNDTLIGGLGDDIFDEGGVDALYASGSVEKGLGDDVINGGAGTDRADYGERTADLTITLCIDTVTTGAPASTASECTDSDGDGALTEDDNVVNVEELVGGAGNDMLTGSTAGETIQGGVGNDRIDGGAGDDMLFGDDDDDDLAGGAGDDYLDGGDGDDTMDGGSGDGDICVTEVTDTNAPTTCEP
jgi:Ca2+-binding RTX toxin-like protein